MGVENPVIPSVTRRRRGPLLFVPAKWQRPAFLVTLRRAHAWTGFWGAALFLLLGSSGFLLNHRSVLPVDVGAPVAVNTVQLAVRPGTITNEDALGAWAHDKLGLLAAVIPRPAPDAATPRRSVQFLDRQLVTARIWARTFYLPNQKITVTYIPGSTTVSAKVETLGILAVVKNLHKGTGLGVAWVLLIDTIAGALIAMSLTGFLLWSRLHGSRILAGMLAVGAITWALAGSATLFG